MIIEKFEISSYSFTVREKSPDSFKVTVEYDFMKPYKYDEDRAEFKKAILRLQNPVFANLHSCCWAILKFLEHATNI